ncbi:EpsG family protein [Megamonas funiformis]|uniref:EpsG family protein n=1 Tax=Megamonas funiformis TaxID=437897 RepID=UPI0026DB5A52|nr:EpsG family protein [Megamonas funiformis]
MNGKEYLLLLGIISSFACWLDLINLKKLYKNILFLFILIFALYCGCYYFPYSADYVVYQSYYTMASSSFNFECDAYIWESIVDYGYLWFHTIIKSFGGDLIDVYFFTCAISLIIYFITFKKYTSYIFLSWYFLFVRYFLIQNIHQIRQGLACALMIFALQFVYKRKIILFITIILIAALIHKSLIVALLIYPFSKINWNTKKFIIVMIICTILYIFPITTTVFETVLPAMGIYIPKYDAYLSGTDTVDTENIDILTIVSRYLFITVLSYFLLKWKNIPYNNIFLSMLILAMIFLCIFSDFAVISGRLSAIFLLAFTFAPASLFYGVKSIKVKLYIMGFLVIIGMIFIIKNYLLSNNLSM